MEKYYSVSGSKIEDPKEISYTEIEILNFLKGQKLSQGILNYIYAVNPSFLRIVKSCRPGTLNHHDQRVTIWLDVNHIVKKITQEVVVGCEGYEDAHEMDIKHGNDFRNGYYEKY